MTTRLGSALLVAVLLAVVADVSGGAAARRVGSAGVWVDVPPDWQSIAQRAAPRGSGIVDPVTRIVAASGPIALDRGCNELDYALAPRAVALVVVEWLRPTPGATWRARPRTFTALNLPVRRGLLECVPGQGGSIQFATRGRRFAAFVIAADGAPPASVRRARVVLDTPTVRRRG